MSPPPLGEDVPAPGAADPAALALLVEPPSGKCQRVEVARNPFVIGRLPECDLTLRDSRISRRHARIKREERVYFIEDLQSRHGLAVNGERVLRHRLAAGDRVTFGVADSFVLTVVEAISPAVPLLRKVATLAAAPRRTGALGRLSAILDVARTVEASEGVDEVFEAVVEAALTITGAESAFLLLRNDSGNLEVRVARSKSGDSRGPEDLEVPPAKIAQALARRRDLFTMSGSVALDSRDDTFEGELDSALCVPILRMRLGQDHETSLISARRDTLGALYLDTENSGAGLAEGLQALLHALAIEVSTVLENARLLEQEREKRRLEQELRTARDIQQALLPASLPSDGWLVAKGRCDPSLQVGGDYFDLMQVAPGQWGAVVVDVSGKGVAASLLAALLQGAFFVGADPAVSLSGTLGRINRYICERSAQTRFATVFALVLDAEGGLRWCNAGHCPALLVRTDGEIERLPPNSRPVGLFADAEFPEDRQRLRPGDKLVVYTDGVSEARNPAQEQFGERGLERAVAGLAALGPEQFYEGLLGCVLDFVGGAARHDDLTLLVLAYNGPPGSAAASSSLDSEAAAASPLGAA